MYGDKLLVSEPVGSIKRAAAESARIKEFYLSIFESTPNGMVVCDTDGVILLVNSSFCEITGYSRSDIEGKLWIGDIIQPRIPQSAGTPLSLFDSATKCFEHAIYVDIRDRRARNCTMIMQAERVEGMQCCICSFMALPGTDVIALLGKDELSHMRALTEPLESIIFTLDSKGCITFMSPLIERMFGYTAEDVTGDHISKYIVSDESSPPGGEIERIMEGKISPTELRLLDNEGNIRDVRTYALPFTDSNTGLTRIHGILFDITDQRRTERALQESEERYRSLVENHPDPILVIRNQKIIFANTAGMKLIGARNPSDILHKTLDHFVQPHGSENIQDRILQPPGPGRPREPLEMRLLRIDSSMIDVEVTSVPVRFRSEHCLQVIIRDISDKKEMERAIEYQTRKLSVINQIIRVANSSFILEEMMHIILSITVEVMKFDIGWVFLKEDDGRTALLLSSYNVPEQFIEKFSTLHMRDYPYNVIFFGGQPRFIENTPENTPGLLDTRILEDLEAVSYAGVPLIADSVIVGALFVGRCAECRFSDEERSLLECIGREIGGTVLKGMLQERLEEAYEETSSYLDIVERDIRESNIALMDCSKVVKDMLSGPAEQYAEKLQNTIQQMTEVINNVSIVRKVQAENADLEPVDLDRVISCEREKFPDIEIGYEEAGYVVFADEYLSEVFSNCILNCVKFGGPDVQIQINTHEEDGMVTVRIEDTGPGIPDERKEDIFTVFSKNSTNECARGLGLHIARMLITRYCGKIWVEDRVSGKPSKGLALCFTLAFYDE